ncbi:MAG: bifunctional alpha/beta hydrolase/OsmC family protein, partial [Myxococcota bacterium]
HSLGGAAVLAAASRVSEVKAVSTIGAPFDPGHVRHLIDDAAPDLEERGESEVVLAGRRFRIKRQFLDDIANQSSQEAIARLGAALLVCHSPQDEIVGVDNAREIFVAARHPKSFISLDGADHLLGRRADSEYVALVLSAWANRYLAAPEETDVPQGTVRVRGGKKNFTQEVVAGPHRLIADEPKSFGGADLGPNPYDYLLAGLGACTTMTVRMYADRKQWPLDAVECSLTHKKIHAKECEDCESESGPVDIIDRTLTLEGDLDEAHRTRLTEIADKCPVHKSLTTETRIRTELKS